MEGERHGAYHLFVSIQHEPGISKRVKRIAQHMNTACRSITLDAHDGDLAGAAPGHIGNQDGVAVFVSLPGRIDKYIPGLDILDCNVKYSEFFSLKEA